MPEQFIQASSYSPVGSPAFPPYASRPWAGGSVLSRAVAMWHAGNYSSNLDALIDESGHGLHARFGSGVGADTNDPLRLPYEGSRSVYSPSIAANYLSCPANAAFNITDDIEIICRARPSDLSTQGTFLAKRETGQWSYQFIFAPGASALQFGMTTDGSTALNYNSSAFPPLLADTWYWFKCTRRRSDGRIQYFYANDTGGNSTLPSTWTQVGTDITGSTGAMFVGTAGLEIFTNRAGVANVFLGRGGRYILNSGIGGTTVADFNADFIAQPFSSYTDVAGKVWTFNRTLSGTGRRLVVVDRDALLLGGDDYLIVPDHPLLRATSNFTIIVAARLYGVTPPSRWALAGKRGTTLGHPGYVLFTVNGGRQEYLELQGDTISGPGSPQPSFTDGRAFTHGLRIVGGKQQLVSSNGNAGSAVAIPTGALDDGQPLYLGAWASGTSPLDGEIFAAAVFNTPLTDSDIVRLQSELNAIP